MEEYAILTCLKSLGVYLRSTKTGFFYVANRCMWNIITSYIIKGSKFDFTWTAETPAKRTRDSYNEREGIWTKYL